MKKFSCSESKGDEEMSKFVPMKTNTNNMNTKNLKQNPALLMLLRRKNAVESFVIEMAFNPSVKEISVEFNRKNFFVITCNGITKAFPINTPLINIKREVSKCLTADYSSKFKYSDSISELMQRGEENQMNYRLAI